MVDESVNIDGDEYESMFEINESEIVDYKITVREDFVTSDNIEEMYKGLRVLYEVSK